MSSLFPLRAGGAPDRDDEPPTPPVFPPGQGADYETGPDPEPLIRYTPIEKTLGD